MPDLAFTRFQSDAAADAIAFLRTVIARPAPLGRVLK